MESLDDLSARRSLSARSPLGLALAAVAIAAHGPLSRRIRREAAGAGAGANGRRAVRLAPCRQRRRSESLGNAAGGIGVSTARLAMRRLDDHANRLRAGPPPLSRLDRFLLPAGFQLGRAASAAANSSDAAGSGGARALAEPDPARRGKRNKSRRGQRPAQSAQLSRLRPSAMADPSAVAAARSDRRAERGIRRTISRARGAAGNGSHHRLAEIRPRSNRSR